MQFLKKNLIPLLVLCGIVLAVLIPINPSNMPYTQRDSGVFLYTGWRITEGDLPYRDIWDHKPPVIFYINAFGLSLTNGSRWGVWIIELIFLLVTAILGYFLFKKIFNKQTAYINMILFVASFHFLFIGGNMTNEYVLPLQVLTLWMLLSLNKDRIDKGYWILLGLLAALAFFMKQTAISLWVAILIYHAANCILNKTWKKWFVEIGLFALGGGILTVIVVGYFWINGGLLDFFNAAFKFNYVYASLGISIWERLNLFMVNFSSITPTGILVLGLFGIVIVIPTLKNGSIIKKEYRPLILISLISMPIEIFFISLSGRGYEHYFISLIPLLSVFSGLTIWLLFRQLSEISGSIRCSEIAAICLSGLIIFTLYQSYEEANDGNQWIDDSYVVNYIDGITAPDDTIVIWGAEAKDYFAAKRASATKYVYLYPLYTHNYANEERISEFLDEIIENQPKIILDTKSPDMPYLTFPIESTEIDSRINWIQNNYYELEPLGNWTVYKRNQN